MLEILGNLELLEPLPSPVSRVSGTGMRIVEEMEGMTCPLIDSVKNAHVSNVRLVQSSRPDIQGVYVSGNPAYFSSVSNGHS